MKLNKGKCGIIYHKRKAGWLKNRSLTYKDTNIPILKQYKYLGFMIDD